MVMIVSYDEIISCFLSKITDPDFLTYSEEVINELMIDWLHSSASNPYIRVLYSSLKFNDFERNVYCELKYSSDDEIDAIFVQDIIARCMVIAWLEPKVKSTSNIHQMFSGKEAKFYAQSTHLKEIKDLLETEKSELRKIIRDYGYINNSYLKGGTVK